MTNIAHKRILSLDPRPRRLGYVVYEGRDELLDWGVKRFRRGVNTDPVPLGTKVEHLLGQWQPEILLMKKPRDAEVRKNVSAIHVQARSYGIRVRVLPSQAVRAIFASQANKDEIAGVIAERFPELLSRLPPRRRPWQTEDVRMSIFDAAALGIAYFATPRQQGWSASEEVRYAANGESFRRSLTDV